MRRVLGWLLVVLGAVVFVPALAAAIWVGADDTATTGPHDLTTAGVAIATEPAVLHYVGPVLHLTVQRADGEPVFVGIANEVDAKSYLGDRGSRVIERVGLPWDVTSGELEGSADAVPPPGEQPWWLESAEGVGAQELVWPLPHGRYSIVGLNADGSAGVDARVTLGLEIEGTFYTLLAIAAFGLLLVLLGVWLLLRRRRSGRPPSGPDAGPDADRSAARPTDRQGAVGPTSAHDPEPTVQLPQVRR